MIFPLLNFPPQTAAPCVLPAFLFFGLRSAFRLFLHKCMCAGWLQCLCTDCAPTACRHLSISGNRPAFHDPTRALCTGGTRFAPAKSGTGRLNGYCFRICYAPHSQGNFIPQSFRMPSIRRITRRISLWGISGHSVLPSRMDFTQESSSYS